MLRLLIRLSNLPLLLLVALAYLLGAGIARYLGFAHQPLVFWLGLCWVLLTMLFSLWLAEFFRPAGELYGEEQTTVQRDATNRLLFLLSGLTLILIGALTSLLLVICKDNPPLLLVLFLTFILALLYGLPPLRLVYSGYGELLQALLLSNFTPLLAYLLQSNDLHSLLPAVTLPLAMLALSSFLALGFPSYAADQKYDRQTLVRRLGWKRAISIHRLFLLLAYLLFAAALVMDFPVALFWPVFLTLPLAFLQLYWFNRIAAGAPPRWNFFNALAFSLLGLTLYVLTLTFWMR